MRRTGRRGMTLIELLIAGSIMLLLGAGLFAMAGRAWANYDAILTQNMVQREARAALDMACDEVRNVEGNVATGRWSTSVIAYEDANGSHIGRSGGMFPFEIFRTSSGLLRHTTSRTAVSNISQFNVTYVLRVRSADGTLRWKRVPSYGPSGTLLEPPMNNRPPGIVDPRITAVCYAVITVTAERNGYRSTLTSAVKARNQFYSIAPPLGM